MTLMRIREDTETVQIDVEGHAGYNPGNDIVCAAISTMCYALINRLQIMYGHNELADLIVIDDPGDFHITVVKNHGSRQKWYYTREFFVTGMEMIAEQYPDYLEVKEE